MKSIYLSIYLSNIKVVVVSNIKYQISIQRILVKKMTIDISDIEFLESGPTIN